MSTVDTFGLSAVHIIFEQMVYGLQVGQWQRSIIHCPADACEIFGPLGVVLVQCTLDGLIGVNLFHAFSPPSVDF